MTENEIKRIRNNFILLSTLTLFGVMLLMGGCIYLFNTATIRNESFQIMNYIAENDGELPKVVQSEDSADYASTHTTVADQAGADDASAHTTAVDPQYNTSGSFSEEMEWSLQGIFGVGNFFGEMPDYSYTTRYFAVLFGEDESVEEIKTNHIAYIDEEQAELYARIALHRVRQFGSFGRYYYYCAKRDGGGTIVIYLDRTAQVTQAARILVAALMVLGLGTLLSFFLMRLFSINIVRREIENVEKQKQFITNASHELKTPLAVIRANTEMQELLDGENEWTQSTLRQVDRMSGLIGNLVQIARAREKTDGKATAIDIVPAVSDTADYFQPVAASEGKTLIKDLPSSLVIKADDSKIRQLTSVLVDNAVKYCDDHGTILVRLSQSGKGAVLAVSNDYAEGGEVDYSRFFERFYRQDEARTIFSGSTNSNAPDDADSNAPGTGTSGTSGAASKGGFGIGLSIAESLVKSMNGTISVSWKDGLITFTCRL